jgi:ABC-type molybdate transport system permease subunit
VVVASRLGELDKSIEEAAMDLGANRVAVFFQITLPIIAPALVSGLAAGLHAVDRRPGGRQLRQRALHPRPCR